MEFIYIKALELPLNHGNYSLHLYYHYYVVIANGPFSIPFSFYFYLFIFNSLWDHLSFSLWNIFSLAFSSNKSWISFYLTNHSLSFIFACFSYPHSKIWITPMSVFGAYLFSFQCFCLRDLFLVWLSYLLRSSTFLSTFH